MQKLAGALHDILTPTIPDWPGFGDRPRATVPLTPDTLRRFLAELLGQLPSPLVGIAAGHAAHLPRGRRPPAPRPLRAPRADRPHLARSVPHHVRPRPRAASRRIRRTLEAPVTGQLFYELSTSRPFIARMMRAHVYADAARVTPALVTAKRHVAASPAAASAPRPSSPAASTRHRRATPFWPCSRTRICRRS